MGLRIYNTMSRDKVDFEPIDPNKVRLYLCGITPYAPSHIGHARGLVAFDVVFRWLKTSYPEVVYVRNFTDIDDKIIKAANAEDIEAVALAARFIDQYHASAEKLGCQSPTHEPKVSETIPEIIALIQKIEEHGAAYAVNGDVYFQVDKFPAYGKLSGRTHKDLEELEAGARVSVDERKRSPFDFALWKSAKPGEPKWPSPWGEGRPGWHIECSAMSSKFLGETFDIHGGGKDLVFPHHENEIAQSCAASGKDIVANVWMHNGFVNLMPEGCPKCGAELPEGEDVNSCPSCKYELTEEDFKMSKSRGNFYPVHELLGQYEPEALRALLLSSQYRTPISFSHGLVADRQKQLGRVYETLSMIDDFRAQHEAGGGESFEKLFDIDPRQRLAQAMNDDFNTAKAMAEAGELVRIANDLLHGKEKERIGQKLKAKLKSKVLGEIREALGEYTQVLGLWGDDPKAFLERRRNRLLASKDIGAGEIEAKIAERKAARDEKDFERSDAIRDELAAHGIVLRDTAAGTGWDIQED